MVSQYRAAIADSCDIQIRGPPCPPRQSESRAKTLLTGLNVISWQAENRQSTRTYDREIGRLGWVDRAVAMGHLPER
jgi:hypothetical protein